MLDLNALKDFITVIQEGSFSAAARVRGLPKSTVSKRVQDLEAALDARLIERTTRSLRLTSEGAAFLERASRIVADAEEAETFLKTRSEEPKGHLRIASPQLFGQIYLGQIAAAYRSKHPGTTLEFSLIDRTVNLIDEGFDAAIRIGPLPDSSLMARMFAEADSVVVAAPSLIAAEKRTKNPKDIGSRPCLAFHFSETVQIPWRVQRNEEVVDIPIRPVIAITSLLALREAAIAGAGYTYLPRFIVADDLATGRLANALDGWVGVKLPISIVYSSGRFLNARLRSFIDMVAERFPDRKL